jgi:carboxyl-terminal processing protease
VRIHFQGDPPKLLIVARPDANTPAARAKLARGDHIVEIDDRPTAGMSMDDVLVAMRGPAGQAVRLTILPAGESDPKTIELIREVIILESLLGDVRDEDGRWQFRLAEDPRIAHLRIRSFGDLTVREIRGTLDELVSEGVQGVVLDVRDNAGGTLDAAVEICKLLLPADRLIVETRGRDGQLIDRRMTTGDGPFVALPLAVLINQQSASAAEIVAACLQDHGRAIVVGQRTYGKGTVQQLIATQAGKSTLKLTWASFWRPSGENIHRLQSAAPDDKWGVRPDPRFEVVLPAEEYADYEQYRGQRDLVGLAPLDDLVDQGSGEPLTAPADFVDRQLVRAVEGLQSVLESAGR